VILLRGMQEAIVSDINRLDKELSDVSKGNLRLESVRQEKASYQIRYDRNQEVIRNLTSLQKAEARVQMDEPPAVIPGTERNRRHKYSLVAVAGFFFASLC